MSAISIPVSRPSGRVIVVANASLQYETDAVMQQLGFECEPVNDPYAAIAEVCANPDSFHAIVLSLQSLYREELSVIATIKRRFAYLEIWLTHTDGRQAALAEAMRLGADGLLAGDGLHRLASAATAPTVEPLPAKVIGFVGHTSQGAPAQNLTDEPQSEAHQTETFEEGAVGEPVLTADELRALLQEQPSMPPSGGGRDN
jgi:hypothetical protein